MADSTESAQKPHICVHVCEYYMHILAALFLYIVFATPNIEAEMRPALGSSLSDAVMLFTILLPKGKVV